MPELSPLPTHFVFCPCCVDEEGRINETWHMAGPEKMETQCRLPLMVRAFTCVVILTNGSGICNGIH
jgi:hypothetical protein